MTVAGVVVRTRNPRFRRDAYIPRTIPEGLDVSRSVSFLNEKGNITYDLF